MNVICDIKAIRSVNCQISTCLPMFGCVVPSPECRAKGMQCILKCNQICETFFKDSMLWSHSTPLHHPLLWFRSHYVSFKERQEKTLYQSDLSFHSHQQWHAYKSSWGWCCIIATPNLPEKHLDSTNSNITIKKKGEEERQQQKSQIIHPVKLISS